MFIIDTFCNDLSIPKRGSVASAPAHSLATLKVMGPLLKAVETLDYIRTSASLVILSKR